MWGSNFGIISEALQLAKIVYHQQYILLGNYVVYNLINKNRNYVSLKLDTKYWTTENILNLNNLVFNSLQRALAAEKRLLKTLEGSGQKCPVLRYSDNKNLFIQSFWSKTVQQNWVINIHFRWYDHPYCQSIDHTSCFVNAGLH